MDICGPNGRCINIAGGYRCECDPGWVLGGASPPGVLGPLKVVSKADSKASSSPRCIDNRRASCWTHMNEVDGRCEANFPGTVLKAECCCSASNAGVAWGSPCER